MPKVKFNGKTISVPKNLFTKLPGEPIITYADAKTLLAASRKYLSDTSVTNRGELRKIITAIDGGVR